MRKANDKLGKVPIAFIDAIRYAIFPILILLLFLIIVIILIILNY